jgi:Zn-dependent protease with chaperone function
MSADAGAGASPDGAGAGAGGAGLDAAGADRERVAAPVSRPLVALALVVGVPLWLLAARALWQTSVPDGLRLTGLDAHADFGARYLARSASFERFLAIDQLLALVALVAVVVVYARRGERLMRESAAGPIGTGMMLGMLGVGLTWLVTVPFDVAGVWWERRHGISHEGYVTAILGGYLGLASAFLAISLALLIAMFLARKLRGWWWLAAAPVFVGLVLLQTFVSPYLVSADTEPLSYAPVNARLAADAHVLARREGVPNTRFDIERVDTPPNAEALGFGPSRHVVLSYTLVRGDFRESELRVVVAHELGHLSHDHILKSVGWYALFLLPLSGLIVLVTRRRGGLARPEAVPLALLVVVVAGVVATPLRNVVSRRIEAEADWAALQATHDPAAAHTMFQRLTRTHLADPDPPALLYVLGETHPTAMQRIAMAQAWAARHPQR